MSEPVELTVEHAPQIAAFSRVACPFDLLSTTSVRRSIFDDPDPQLVLAAYDGGLDGIGVGVVRGNHAWVKFLAVHPRSRGRGVGKALLNALESFASEHGAPHIDVGTSAPYYVVPGVDVRSTEAACFFEASGYERAGEAVNLGVRLVSIPEPSLSCRVAAPEDLSALREWVDREYPNWIDELSRGVALGACVVHDDVGFACFDVNREGWFGPIATRSDHRSKGVGAATLLAALQMMRARGHERAEIAWATALPFYVKTVGARVSRVFWGYRKSLNPR